MKPQLLCGDCLTIMANLPAESVDLIFADPPFNVGKRYGNSHNDRKADYREWCGDWIQQCFRLLKPTGSFYLMTITRHLPWKLPLMERHGTFINLISWRNASSASSKRCFLGEYQPIILYGKSDRYIFNTYAQTTPPKFQRWGKHKSPPRNQMKDRWDDITRVYAGSIHHPEAILLPNSKRKAHIAQMPIGLPQRAILFSTHPGMIVLDPFLGSGTTVAAALSINRLAIGIDLEPQYIKLAKSRLNHTTQ